VRAILDTSVLIAADSPPFADELAISVVTLTELHYGVLSARDSAERAERLRRLAILEHTFDALPVDDAVARSYGELAAAVGRIGRNPQSRTADLLIAATAHAHGARLYTKNPADLRGLESLLDIVKV
jgi:predicted nucleic acid-binding protein